MNHPERKHFHKTSTRLSQPSSCTARHLSPTIQLMFARISTSKFRGLCEKSFNNCCDRQVAKKIPLESEQDLKKVVFGENLHEARDKSLFCGRKLCQKPFRNQNLSGLQFVWVLAENVAEASRKNSENYSFALSPPVTLGFKRRKGKDAEKKLNLLRFDWSWKSWLRPRDLCRLMLRRFALRFDVSYWHNFSRSKAMGSAVQSEARKIERIWRRFVNIIASNVEIKG